MQKSRIKVETDRPYHLTHDSLYWQFHYIDFDLDAAPKASMFKNEAALDAFPVCL